jgi:hypothetical protein
VAPEASFYTIEGDPELSVERFVVSTPQSRDICNKPELLGCLYTDKLRAAMASILWAAPFRDEIEGAPEEQICVLSFLRGGLNFGLRDALHQAYGLNRHSSAFMSSQRAEEGGRWSVREDGYRKLNIPAGAVVLVGDVVATGVTLEHGLRVLIDHLVEVGSSIRRLIFFTIGCQRAEEVLAGLDVSLREAFTDFQGSRVIYLEGRFRLVEAEDELRIGLPGTDLIRRDCLLAPEFEASQYDRLAAPLERCAIYDAGSRAFDIPEYLADLREYWEQVAALAAGGLTLAEALRERWPESNYTSPESLRDAKRQIWRGLDDQELYALHRRYSRRWTPTFTRRADTAEALAELCAERIAALDVPERSQP